MLTRSRYSVKEFIMWSRHEILLFSVYASLVTYLYSQQGLTFLSLPWTPLALIGTAVAFMVGFQNNSAYGRIWEARKIWGGIVNISRSWAMKVSDMVSNDHASNPLSDAELKEVKRTLIYRHIAWLTALRYAMRERKKWEVFEEHRTNREWSNMLHIPEKVTSFQDELINYLHPSERERVFSKGNKGTALLFLQSENLRKLKEKGYIWEFAFLNLEDVLQEMFELQGKSERIKNFPYPRQYATLGYFFVCMFIILLPFGIVPEFSKIPARFAQDFPVVADYFVWLSVPFCGVVSWVFYTMERIGRVGENPFEGTANDVPISTIARGIEIDLLQMINEDEEMIPKPFPQNLDIQM